MNVETFIDIALNDPSGDAESEALTEALREAVSKITDAAKLKELEEELSRIAGETLSEQSEDER